MSKVVACWAQLKTLCRSTSGAYQPSCFLAAVHLEKLLKVVKLLGHGPPFEFSSWFSSRGCRAGLRALLPEAPESSTDCFQVHLLAGHLVKGRPPGNSPCSPEILQMQDVADVVFFRLKKVSQSTNKHVQMSPTT